MRHDGSGNLPGIKHNGHWEIRPHRDRFIRVDAHLLHEWGNLTGRGDLPERSPLLYPVTKREQSAISSLVYAERLTHLNPFISGGYHEKGAKDRGLIRWNTRTPDSMHEVILQGPHLHIANPLFKQPNEECRSKGDWSPHNLTTLPVDFVPRTNYSRSTSEGEYVNGQDRWEGEPYTRRFRLAWRRMVPLGNERSLFATIIPPGPAHVHTVQSMAFSNNRLTTLNAGFWAALPLDYLLRITGRSDLQVTEARKMPSAAPSHPLAPALLLRTLRLNALTDAYAPLWEELYDPTWPAYEGWANPGWPNLRPLAGHLKPTWEYDTPLRTEYERRAALVELDALVSVWLGITADQLVAIYKSRYPVLSDYEAVTYFDANGRKSAGNHNTYGYGQTKQDYVDLLAHLENPANNPPPAGYTGPFYKADREAEMRAAHAHFQARLDKEIAAGRWTPPERQTA